MRRKVELDLIRQRLLDLESEVAIINARLAQPVRDGYSIWTPVAIPRSPTDAKVVTR